jgi:Zn-dependent alcohol dehydrogenase
MIKLIDHENSGIAKSAGEGVTGVAAGNRVMSLYTPECGGVHSANLARPTYASRTVIYKLSV